MKTYHGTTQLNLIGCCYLFMAMTLGGLSVMARTWTDLDGRSFEGELVEQGEDSLQIKRSLDGVVFDVVRERLSKADQNYLDEVAGSLAKEAELSDKSNYTLKRFDLKFKGKPSEPVKLSVKYNHHTVWEGTLSGEEIGDTPIFCDTDFNESTARSDRILLYIKSESFAGQWYTLERAGNRLTCSSRRVVLYPKKFAVIEYEFFKGDDLDFTNREPDAQGVAAVGHWGNLPFFGEDWQIWQGSEGDDMFGEVLQLKYHRYSPGFGMTDPLLGSLDRHSEAPKDGYAPARSDNRPREARKGKVYICHVQGNTASGMGYGKFRINDIVTEVPPGMTVLE